MCLKEAEGTLQERFVRQQIAKYEARRKALVAEHSEYESGKPFALGSDTKGRDPVDEALRTAGRTAAQDL
jgi:hypothetical protein